MIRFFPSHPTRKTYRIASVGFLFALLLVATQVGSRHVSGQKSVESVPGPEQTLNRFELIRLEPQKLLKSIEQTGRITLNTTNASFDLELQPFDIRANNYRGVAVGPDGISRVLERTPSRFFRGRVAGKPDTFVRFVIDEQSCKGIIITPDETFFVEPRQTGPKTAGVQESIFYAESDVKQESFGECATTLAQQVSAEAVRLKPEKSVTASGVPRESIFTPLPEAEVATEADFEFTQTFGGDATLTNNDILDILAQVDGIYEAQIGIKLRVVFQRAFLVNNDPYTQTDPFEALDEFSALYNSSFAPGAPPARDMVHLFTGKDLDGSTIGVAYTGAICEISAYGLSQSKFNATTQLRVGLTAHEIGHIFGAVHPNQQTPVPSGCDPSIMNSFIQNTTNFCQFSRDQITDLVVNKSSCLTRTGTAGCTYAVSPAVQQFGSGSVGGSVNVTTQPTCNWAVAEGLPWLSVVTGETGTGNGTASFSLDANSGGPRTGNGDIGGQLFQVRQAASPACGLTPIAFGQTLNGVLSTTDCRSGQPSRVNTYIDLYTFAGTAGQRVAIEMKDDTTQAPIVDTYLYLYGPDGSVMAQNDDAQNTDARIPIGGFFILPQTGTYIIEATSFASNETGNYTLLLTSDSSISFGSPTFGVSEGADFATFTVNRTGNSSAPATVKYATSDATDVNFVCNPSTAGQITGAASRKCDYHIAAGRLRFAAGETTKTIVLSIVNDVYVEGPETLTITLSDPTGAVLGATNQTTVTITDNDNPGQANPIDGTGFYVRMLYVDLLSREPDPAGFNGWVHRIDFCGQPGEPPPPCDRVTVGGDGFLRSAEFFDREFFVIRLYRTALGRILRYDDVGDLAYVSGFLTDADLELNKQDLVTQIMGRPEFGNIYNALSNAQYVDTMISTAAVTLPAGVRDGWVNALNASTKTRAQVFRELSERAEVSAKYLHEAQVVSCYYGFFTRNPDAAYFTFLQRYDNGEITLGDLANAFINAAEYRQRFGP